MKTGAVEGGGASRRRARHVRSGSLLDHLPTQTSGVSVLQTPSFDHLLLVASAGLQDLFWVFFSSW